MKIRSMIKRFALAALVLALTCVTYSNCWVDVYQPQCAMPGDCFGSCEPVGCSVSTCIQATGFGYEDWYNQRWLAAAGKTTRIVTDDFNTCLISGCRLYNNCTHTYDPLPINCFCGFAVIVYRPGPTACP